VSDKGKTKAQLILELEELRRQLGECRESHATRGQTESESEEARGYAESIIATIREPLLVLDWRLKIVTANRAFYKTFEVTPTHTIGSLIFELGNRQWDIPVLRTLLENIIVENTAFEDFEVSHDFEGIGRKVVLLNARRIHRDHIGTRMILLAMEDVTDRRQMEEKLLAVTMTDDLTGLTNRRGFFAMADKLLKVARRQGESVFLLYVDLDGLKTINDTLGHEEGDRALVDAARILEKTYRDSDVVARIGGDEFTVLQVGAAAASAGAIRSRLDKAVAVHDAGCSRRYKISLSAGMALWTPEAAGSINELLALADKAMYEEKRAKRKAGR
jgi:diguanylate cyclase (GGDEF)-like protein/PAS domain S-box-containing protein